VPTFELLEFLGTKFLTILTTASQHFDCLIIVGGLFFVTYMMLGESRLRLDFRLGTWSKGYRWSV